MVKVYEQRIAEFETRKLVLQEKLAESPPDRPALEATLRTAMQFLASPWNLWISDRVEDKRAVLKLTFKERLGYSKTKGLRTPELSFPFKLLTDFFGDEGEIGAPGTIRTSDPQIRSLMLYPAELRARMTGRSVSAGWGALQPLRCRPSQAT